MTSRSQGTFSGDKKPRYLDSKTEKLRHQDSKTKEPQNRVSVEFRLLCLLIP